jgi:hypothetical protein
MRDRAGITASQDNTNSSRALPCGPAGQAATTPIPCAWDEIITGLGGVREGCTRWTPGLFRAEDAQAMMLFEILVILEVQRREPYLVGEAAGCYPLVVDWARASALECCRDRRPQTAPTASSPGRTGSPDSHPACRQRRIAHGYRVAPVLVRTLRAVLARRNASGLAVPGAPRGLSAGVLSTLHSLL